MLLENPKDNTKCSYVYFALILMHGTYYLYTIILYFVIQN